MNKSCQTHHECVYTKDMTTTTMNNKDFSQVLEIMMNEWDRCINIQIASGSTRGEAAETVGTQMHQWLDNNDSK